MIVDVARWVAAEQPYWRELDTLLQRLELNPETRPSLAEAQRLHYLYQRGLHALAKLQAVPGEPELRRYVESLVARAYSRAHETRARGARMKPWLWLRDTFPQTFRRRLRAFQLSVALTVVGVLFGCLALAIDREAKEVIMPFSHLTGKPSERVRQEETRGPGYLEGHQGEFAGQLMTHNTQVTITTFALGASYGVGSAILLFYNGVILGAVAWDYVMDGQTIFLLGWLLPHGSVEIPAILLGGQAAFVLAGALIGWGERTSRRQRLRAIVPDLAHIVGGAALLLIWAGIVESFFSQYHAPIVPYGVKIAFGSVQLLALAAYLAFSGRRVQP